MVSNGNVMFHLHLPNSTCPRIEKSFRMDTKRLEANKNRLVNWSILFFFSGQARTGCFFLETAIQITSNRYANHFCLDLILFGLIVIRLGKCQHVLLHGLNLQALLREFWV